MYCVIIGTRVNYNAGGMCYDFFSCASEESALAKLSSYHKEFCSGTLTCIHCNYNDQELVNDNKPWSLCKVLCDECKINSDIVNDKCKKCTYCDDCDECTIYKCNDQCEKICYKCDYDGTLSDCEIGEMKCTKNSYYTKNHKCSYSECVGGHYREDNTKVNIYYLDKEMESWRNCC